MTWDNEWATRARCVKWAPDDMFVSGTAQNQAKVICLSCPVRTECLADALDHRDEFGVWGGTTVRFRRALLKRYPNVVSWREVLEAARDKAMAAKEPT